MPTYQYACNDCGEQLEVVQRFTDDALTQCPACQGKLRKVFSPVGVVFKGSGFYRNDSRQADTKATASSNGKKSDSTDSSGSSSSADKSGSSEKAASSASSGSSDKSGSNGSSSSSSGSGSGSTKAASGSSAA